MPLTGQRYRAPSIKELSFNCPHCGALAKQFWHSVLAERLADDRLPIRFTPEEAKDFVKAIQEKEVRENLRQWADRVGVGQPFIDDKRRDPYAHPVYNVSVSQCYNCDEIGIWLNDRLAWPVSGDMPIPNSDLSLDVKRDYEEAAAIVDASPRGAAALLRLAIQKICVELGGAGKNLNDDIAGLVAKGLDVRVQQALDVVRVIGNNAVHPGELDLRDDRAIAEKLFDLVNLIAEIMISQPKHVASLFGSLPEGARRGVEQRNKANV